jgi:mannosyltransferase OCH1-like enzyme
MKPLDGIRACFIALVLLQVLHMIQQQWKDETFQQEHGDYPSSTVDGSSSAIHQHDTIPLLELIDFNSTKSQLNDCSKLYPSVKNLTMIHSTILPISITHFDHHHNSSKKPRKIPKIIHITSKSKCTLPEVAETINKWRLPNHSLYFHDDTAMETLLQRDWVDFPFLKMIQKCLVSGAAKADLWRLLILWEYGGIYTDFDTAPGALLLEASGQSDAINNRFIDADDEAFFVVETEGFLSQYFMASSPKHPLIYMTIMHILQRLLGVSNIKEQYVPYVTGPGALKTAFIDFMGGKSDGKPPAGIYRGAVVGNHTVTVKGGRQTSHHYVRRTGINPHVKMIAYEAVGMKHFNQVKKDQKAVNSSCITHLYNTMKNDTTSI